ncbi:MAG: hypothetical protein HND47_16125 [Chloroflexi bacterium]|nr:hypothetical protein [Chloroflexota bacterium]
MDGKIQYANLSFGIERQTNMNTLSEISLFAGGIYNLGFTIFHLFF